MMMNDNFMQSTLNFAFDHKIRYELTSAMNSDTPSGSSAYHRSIVINLNWYDQQQLPFVVAHETAHVLCSHRGISYFCDSSNSATEAEANRTAVDILVPMYFEDIDPEDANYHAFLDSFHIGESMADYSIDTIDDYYRGDLELL